MFLGIGLVLTGVTGLGYSVYQIVNIASSLFHWCTGILQTSGTYSFAWSISCEGNMVRVYPIPIPSFEGYFFDFL